MHNSIRQASLSLPEVTLWHHTCTSRIYDCQLSGNRSRKNLLQGKSWDTDDLNLPHRYLLKQEDKQQSTIRIATADPLAVYITATEELMDGFIDNIIPITVDDEHWIDYAKSAALLVICTLF